MIHHGDCLEVMPTLDAESVSAIVTDPPYDLLTTSRNGSRRINNPDNPAGRTARGFMGKTWDGTGVAFRAETWDAALRVAKPGAYLLAFGGTRTYHRLASAIEDAGWEIRDCLVWAYASGFPKSLNLDGDWKGWGTALKPAWEPIVMARKPLRGTVRANVEAHGTGALNIDGTRVPLNGELVSRDFTRQASTPGIANPQRERSVVGQWENTAGRWPANVILTDPIFDGGWEGVVGGGETGPAGVAVNRNRAPGSMTSWMGTRAGMTGDDAGYGDSGTYSRFFLIPKADRADREPVLGGLPERRPPGWSSGEQSPGTFQSQPTPARQNVHPTVKPTDLMRHLVRLVTPPGGTVLDPFLGSGTTGLACELEGFPWIGIEREEEYVRIAEARLNGTQRGLGLSA